MFRPVSPFVEPGSSAAWPATRPCRRFRISARSARPSRSKSHTHCNNAHEHGEPVGQMTQQLETHRCISAMVRGTIAAFFAAGRAIVEATPPIPYSPTDQVCVPAKPGFSYRVGDG